MLHREAQTRKGHPNDASDRPRLRHDPGLGGGGVSRPTRTAASPHLAPSLLGRAQRGVGHPDPAHPLLRHRAGLEEGRRRRAHRPHAREGGQPAGAAPRDPRPGRQRSRAVGPEGPGPERHAPAGGPERDRDGGVRPARPRTAGPRRCGSSPRSNTAGDTSRSARNCWLRPAFASGKSARWPPCWSPACPTTAIGTAARRRTGPRRFRSGATCGASCVWASPRTGRCRRATCRVR